MSETTPLMRKSEIVIQELDNELLVYDLKADKALSLNETSALVWQLSTGEKTIQEIAAEVSKKINTRVTQEFVWLALWRLKKENLLENETEIPNSYQGATRREIMQKIGFASLVALPIITSILAPTAAHAQSGACSAAPFPLSCPCVSSPDCSSGCCGSNANPPTPATSFCVTAGLDTPGAVCARSCECASGCCGLLGPLCAAAGSVAPGGSCRLGCACTSGTCGGGNICA